MPCYDAHKRYVDGKNIFQPGRGSNIKASMFLVFNRPVGLFIQTLMYCCTVPVSRQIAISDNLLLLS